MRLDTKSAREKLPARREPWWNRIDTGAYLGYRKLNEGEGTWIARWRDEQGKQHYRALGQHPDYTAAVRLARDWFQANAGGAAPECTTVETACRHYIEHLRTHKTSAAATDAEGRFRRLVFGTPIAKLPLDRLKTTDLRRWLNDQLGAVDDDDDPDDLRRAKDSANRNLASFKAALNLALKDRLVATDAGWKTVTPFPKSGKRRDRFLSLSERRALLAACPDDLKQLVTALLLLGCRPGEITQAKTSDFDRRLGTLALFSNKSDRRIVGLSTAALAFIAGATKDKIGGALILTRSNGLRWTKDDWKGPFKAAVTAAGLPSDVVIYTLRHTAISEMIASDVDVFTVARLAGTSTQMIDRHYGHLRPGRTRERLDRAELL